MQAIVLGLLGLKEFSKDESGHLALTEEESKKIADVLGQPFVDKFKEAMKEASADPQPLIDAITSHNASQNQEHLAQLQAKLDQATKDKETLQASIVQLSSSPEPEPKPEAVGIPRKEGVKTIMKVDMSKPHYRQLASFMKNGYLAEGATIDVADLMQEFGTYLSQGPNNFAMLDTIFQGFTSAGYFTEVQAVTERRAIQALITSVSQQFVNKWTPSGKSQFKPLKIQNRRHKINFPIIPSEVLTSYIFNMYRENLAIDQMPIFYYIWQNLMYPQLMQDIELRMIWKGKFEELDWAGVTAGDAGQAPEKSMDGLETIIATNRTGGNPDNIRFFDGDGFDYKTATDQEVLDFFRDFFKWMAPVFRSMAMNVGCSYELRMRYREAYKNKWGTGSGTESHEFGSNKIDYSRHVLTEMDGMYGSPILFATPKANMVKLRHINAAPAVINDVQKQDYEARIFGEYWMGAGFDYGEAVFAFCPADYDPHALITSVYGAHTEYQQFKGTDTSKSVTDFGSGSAGGGV
ncbi:MAG: hypothetical protein WD552_01430 [Candidatus Paceibacterota bacterium]